MHTGHKPPTHAHLQSVFEDVHAKLRQNLVITIAPAFSKASSTNSHSRTYLPPTLFSISTSSALPVDAFPFNSRSSTRRDFLLSHSLLPPVSYWTSFSCHPLSLSPYSLRVYHIKVAPFYYPLLAATWFCLRHIATWCATIQNLKTRRDRRLRHTCRYCPAAKTITIAFSTTRLFMAFCLSPQ